MTSIWKTPKKLKKRKKKKEKEENGGDSESSSDDDDNNGEIEGKTQKQQQPITMVLENPYNKMVAQ